jgi:hypothetical protein
MTNKMMTMTGLGAMVLGTVLIIVLYGIIPMIGYQIDTAVTIPTNVQATGTIIFTGASAVNNSVNISTETYQFTNGTAGQWKVDVGSDAGNASYSTSQLVAEITANSTLVTAVDNSDNSTTVTSVITGTAGNAYGTTENVTNAAWGATLMSGGIDGSNWDADTNTDLPTGHDFWTTLSGFITLSALMLFIGGFIGVLKGIKG